MLSCSGHSPPLSQIGQSSGWFASSSSSTPFWAAITFGELVWTTMPSATGVVQAVCRRGIFSISTRHIRQAPTGFSFGW